MKRWQKVLLVVALVLATWFALNLWAIGTSVCIVRMEPSGWGLFVIPFDRYYAVREQNSVEVPGWMIFLFCPRAMAGNSYNDNEWDEWHAKLSFDQDGVFGGLDDKLNNPWIPTAHSEHHRLYYGYAGYEIPPAEALELLRHASENLHDGTTEQWVSMETESGIYDLLSLTLYEWNGRQILEIRYNGNTYLYFIGDDGSYRLVLSEPEDWVAQYVHMK